MTMISGFTASSPKVETDVVTMTPQWAQELLDRQSFKNRPLRKNVVARYAREMAAGRWRLTHQGLLIDIDTNEVVDGQHRLHACVVAQKPFETVLTFMDGAAALFPSVDQGTKRSPGDTLAMIDVPDATKTAAALRHLIHWVGQARSENSPTMDTSNDRLVAIIEGNRAVIVRLAQLGTQVANSLAPGNNAAFAAALMAIGNDTEDYDGVVEWAHHLAAGAFTPGSPELALQRWCVRSLREYRGRRKALAIIQAMVRAWNARRDGRDLGKMWIRDGEWPTAH